MKPTGRPWVFFLLFFWKKIEQRENNIILYFKPFWSRAFTNEELSIRYLIFELLAFISSPSFLNSSKFWLRKLVFTPPQINSRFLTSKTKRDHFVFLISLQGEEMDNWQLMNDYKWSLIAVLHHVNIAVVAETCSSNMIAVSHWSCFLVLEKMLAWMIFGSLLLINIFKIYYHHSPPPLLHLLLV